MTTGLGLCPMFFFIGDFRWVSMFSSLKIRSFHQSHGFQSETPLPSAATRSKGGFEVTSQSDSVHVPRGFLCADAGRLGGDVVCFFLMGKWTCWNMFNKNIYNVCLDGNVVSLAHTLFLWVIQTLDIFQWETRHHSTPCSEDGWRSKDLQIGWRSEPWFVFVKHCLYLF